MNTKNSYLPLVLLSVALTLIAPGEPSQGNGAENGAIQPSPMEPGSSAPSLRFHQVRLLVRDFDACFKFYRDVLGLHPTWGQVGRSTYATFSAGGKSGLALFRRDLTAQALGTAHLPVEVEHQDSALVCFEVPDVDDVYAKLRSRGARFVSPPRDYPDWTIRAAYLRDPDGNLIELCVELPRAKWSPRVAEEAKSYESTTQKPPGR